MYNKLDASGNRKPIEDEADFYSGMYARAAISFYSYESNGNKGVSVGVSSIVKIKDGVPLAGVADPTKSFAAIKPDSDEESDDDDL